MTTLVAGEPAHKIMAVFARAEREENDEDLATISITIHPDEVFFARALMRVEAELLLEDADAHVSVDDEVRTSDQRGFDAMVLLMRRTSEALTAARCEK